MADSVPEQVAASHQSRMRFEQLAYNAMIAIIIATALIVLFGIIFPPPAPDLKVADWGMAIVTKAKDSVDVILTLLGSLITGTGVSLTRGHLDNKLQKD